MNTAITLEVLAEKLNGKLWIKGKLKRIYLEEGYNTKKMSTKTYVYEKDGDFKVSCYIDCPSQAYEWIKSQQDKIIEGVNEAINDIIDRLENPEKYEHENYMPYTKRIRTILTPSEKLAAGMEVSFHKNIEEIAKELDLTKCTVTIYGDGSGRFSPIKEGVKNAATIIAEKEAEVKALPTYENCTDFTGEKYKHNIFGIGTKIEEDDRTITLNFNGTKKQLLKKFAKLEKVG